MKPVFLFPKDSSGFFDPSSSITFGGATVQLHAIAGELHAQGAEITALIPDYTLLASGNRPAYPAREAYRTASALPVKIFSLVSALSHEKPDCVIMRGISPLTLPFALLLSAMGIRSVLMFAHDVETDGFYQNIRKRYYLFGLLIRIVNILVCQNLNQKSNLPEVVQDKVIIFKKGVDTADFYRPETEKVYDALWIGRCEKWKNPEQFITLADTSKKLRFVMVCAPGSDSEYHETIMKTARDRENILLFERVSNPECVLLLQQTKIFVLTSESEGDWPMTVLEAAAAGVPIVSLYINIEDSLETYQFGLYCHENIDRMRSAVHELVEDEQKWSIMSHNARSFMSSVHNIHGNAVALLDELERAISKPR
ncbi:MAG: glycosyltransferase family 4 protein [Spirochaetota bacterium]